MILIDALGEAIDLARILRKSGMSKRESMTYASAFVETLKTRIPVGLKEILELGDTSYCFERKTENSFAVYKV